LRHRTPTKKQLAEFDRFWEAEKGPYLRMARGQTETEAKVALRNHYIWLWEGLGCPKRFIPKPRDCDRQEVPTGASNSHDQEVCPNRKWTL